jgi:hypothetical protein
VSDRSDCPKASDHIPPDASYEFYELAVVMHGQKR